MPRVGDPTSSISLRPHRHAAPRRCRRRQRATNRGLGGEFRPASCSQAAGNGRWHRPAGRTSAAPDQSVPSACRNTAIPLGRRQRTPRPLRGDGANEKLSNTLRRAPRARGQQRLLGSRPCQRTADSKGGFPVAAATGQTLAQHLTSQQGGKPTRGSDPWPSGWAERDNIAIREQRLKARPRCPAAALIRPAISAKVSHVRNQEQWGRSRTTGGRGVAPWSVPSQIPSTSSSVRRHWVAPATRRETGPPVLQFASPHAAGRSAPASGSRNGRSGAQGAPRGQSTLRFAGVVGEGPTGR